MLTTEKWNENGTFTLNGKDVEMVDECVHLCIHRDSKSMSGHTKTVDEHIQFARRCACSLMGAGLHGQMGSILWFPLQCGKFSYCLVCCMVLAS